jgi:peptide deformylase
LSQGPEADRSPAGTPGPRSTVPTAGAVRPEPGADPAAVVRQYGDPVLRVKARAIRKINAGVRDLADRMASIMYSVNGIGLAAPQIGESRRLVAVDVGDGLLILINPRVVSGEGSETDLEACLSVVGLCGEVERYQRVRVKAVDLDGKGVTIDADGQFARVLQHELDHLDGVLYTDRALTVHPAASADEDQDGEGEEPLDQASAQWE